MVPHQSPVSGVSRVAVVFKGDYKATRVSPAVASQWQGSGALWASVEMMGYSRLPATIITPFQGSDDQEVSFTGFVLEDESTVQGYPFLGRDGQERVFLGRLSVGAA